MFKNKLSLIFSAFILLVTMLIMPPSIPANASSNTITITISDTVNDCVPDANNLIPIETKLVDAQGASLVNAVWSNRVCTIWPATSEVFH